MFLMGEVISVHIVIFLPSKAEESFACESSSTPFQPSQEKFLLLSEGMPTEMEGNLSR